MKKYKCNVCGYVYDPETGDPSQNIPPGTPFEKLPDSWTCPVCEPQKRISAQKIKVLNLLRG